MPNKKTSFEALTRRGKLSRLRSLAWQALGEYDLQIASLSLLGWFTNLMFRVDTRDGKRYVLRLSAPGWRTDEDCRAETAWLLALARDTDLGAPVPQSAHSGEYILFSRLEGAPTSRCVLQSWVPGVNLGKHLSEPNLKKMGVLFAHLHAHGADWQPPADFTRRRMDQVLARDEPQALFTDDSRGMVPPQTWEVWERTRAAVEAAYARRYAMPGLQVIHHDLWHDNIKLHRGRLYPLDFEDTVWGYPVQDVGMAMQDLMEAVPSERYEPLLEAFRRGYESLHPWPEAYEGEMDTFRAGRMLWVGNYVARFQGQYLREHLEHLAPVLERFLETGKLRKLN
jgi:Ser/Thr protein kinase RdoA (MazF antagonist)